MQKTTDLKTTALGVRRFRRAAILTLGAVIFLIWVGGLVRMTGSGMGCPDWPKCFGQWIPPTDLSQLPADYKVRFQVAGREIADFDPFKTWVEYINRLIGAVIGMLCLVTFGLGARVRKQAPAAFALSAGALLAVVLQGGIGAIVVKTHLQVGLITVHMVVALLIAAMLATVVIKSYPRKPWVFEKKQWAGLAFLTVTLAQIIMGTQVRESVDEVALAMGEGLRNQWISGLTPVYGVHKFFHYAVGITLAFWLFISRSLSRPEEKVLAWSGLACLACEVMLGLAMHHFGVPAWAQPLHLTVGVGLWVIGYGLWLKQVYPAQDLLPIPEKSIALA